MAFLINWLNAIGAFLLLLLVYLNVPEYSLPAAIFISLFALIFPILSFRLRSMADPYLKFNPVLAGIGALLVLGILGGAVYFSVMMWSDLTIAGKVFIGWMGVPAVFMIYEAVRSLIDDNRAMIDDKLEGSSGKVNPAH